MKYILLMYGDERLWTEEERKSCMVESMRICDRLIAEGKYLASSPLESVTTAATVRVRDGQVLVVDGPFAETTEQLGGYYILELANLDEAIAVASALPPATKGTVEIRPVFPLEDLPPSRNLPESAGDADGAKRPFMLLCYDNAEAWRAAGSAALREAMAEAASLARQLSDFDMYVDASPLHLTEVATSVRVRSGKREITDGPFAETNEILGGYYVILAESRDDALRIAARHPGARVGSVEVRPLFDVSGLRTLSTQS
ncbi:YciI family protein [Tautonia marina]|uniref:YciI family protein n=1 Tax=Tautonia marina TaxID=2653855 RepID=UPI0012607C0D|nr:YciI family protein [Tautonia marina]